MVNETQPGTQEIDSCCDYSLPSQVEDINNGNVWGRLYPVMQNLPPLDLINAEYVVGRATDCDVVLREDVVKKPFLLTFSKKHFKIGKEDSGSHRIAYIQDMSSNGTFVNTEQLLKGIRRVLKNNDQISLSLPHCRAYIYVDATRETGEFPEEITKKYLVLRELGSGACGKVYLVFESKSLTKRYAMKVVSKKKFSVDGRKAFNDPKYIDSEVSILKALDHVCPKLIYYCIMLLFTNAECLATKPLTLLLSSIFHIMMLQIKELDIFEGHLDPSPPDYRTKDKVRKRQSNPIKPCIIKIREVIDTPDAVYIILELMEGGELFDRVEREGPLEEPNAKLIFYQIVQAVKYLHSNDITHRDLKPENILLSSNETETLVKVSDFGLSKIVDSQSMLKTFCGTPVYVAPEILRNHGAGTYTMQVDIWSMGVILFVCLGGYAPFSKDRKMPLEQQILQGAYSFPDSMWRRVSSNAIALIRQMLTVDPEKRIKIDDILKHTWLQDKNMIKKAKELMELSVDNMAPPGRSPPLKRKRCESDATVNN